MERLTKRTSNGKIGYALLGPGECVDVIDLLHVWGNRLAAYEDTELSPETVSDLMERFSFFYRTVEGLDIVDPVHFGAFADRVKHWAQAEKDGRMVMLPCKVGDTVYRVITTRDTAPILTEIEIKSLAQAVELIGKIGEHKLLGWYLTREEAEEALKKREETDNESN